MVEVDKDLTGNSIAFAKIDSVYEAVQELTKQTAELAKQLKEFKEVYQKHSKAGKF